MELTKKQSKEIITRIEEVRMRKGMNKSKFSAAIGMKPQTYNNFIGSQGSKPNIELIWGVIKIHKADPWWLLGLDENPEAEAATVDFVGLTFQRVLAFMEQKRLKAGEVERLGWDFMIGLLRKNVATLIPVDGGLIARKKVKGKAKKKANAKKEAA